MVVKTDDDGSDGESDSDSDADSNNYFDGDGDSDYIPPPEGKESAIELEDIMELGIEFDKLPIPVS